MKLKGHVEPSPPPEVVYTILVDDEPIAKGLSRDEANDLFKKSTGYVVMTNQHGHCYDYKGREGFDNSDDSDPCSECGEDCGTKCGAVGCPY